MFLTVEGLVEIFKLLLCGRRRSLQISRVAANILNKQLQTADKGRSSRLGVWLTTDSKKISLLQNVTKDFELGFFGEKT
jgi:hypothetical protein